MSEIKPNNIKNMVWILILLATALGLFLTIKNLTNPGDLDTTFNRDGKLSTDIGAKNERAEAIAIQSDGKIVVVGDHYNVWNEDDDWIMVRYKPDGEMDTAFAGKGYLTIDLGDIDQAWDVGIQPTGKIVIAGQTCNASLKCKIALARYDADGKLDPSFSDGGILLVEFEGGVIDDSSGGLAIQPDGRIVVAGYMYNGRDDDFAVYRFNPNGSLDKTFNTSGKLNTGFGSGKNDFAMDLAIRSGKIVVAGRSCDMKNINCNFALARYNSNGSLDTTFSSDGKVITQFGREDQGWAIAIQPNGKILAAGQREGSGDGSFALARYNSDGSLDTTFSLEGKVITDFSAGVIDGARGIAIRSDGTIIAAGFTGKEGQLDFALARYNVNGALDPTFSMDGKLTTDLGGDDLGLAIAIQEDGRIVVAGCTFDGVDWNFALARYLP